MKRSASLVRRTPLRSGKPLATVGKASVKRKARTRKARQGAHTKAWRLAVLKRDGNRCTAILGKDGLGIATCAVFATGPADGEWRCRATEDLQVHHVTSVRMGEERLEDGVSVCPYHHRLIESHIRFYRRTPA